MFLCLHLFGSDCFFSLFIAHAKTCYFLHFIIAQHTWDREALFTVLRAGRSIPLPLCPPLIIAEQKMRVYGYNSASSETLWTGIKAKGCRVGMGAGENKRLAASFFFFFFFLCKCKAWYDRRKINTIKNEGWAKRKPFKVSGSIKDGVGIIS